MKETAAHVALDMCRRPGDDLLCATPSFSLPFNLSAPRVASEKRRQERVREMVEEEGDDLAAISGDQSKSDEIITDSESSEDPFLALRANRKQRADDSDEEDQESGSANTVSSASSTSVSVTTTTTTPLSPAQRAFITSSPPSSKSAGTPAKRGPVTLLANEDLKRAASTPIGKTERRISARDKK